MIEILGYLGALVIGIVLGLTGGGGSILTVPVLVYILAINPVVATGYSLFVVGTSALFGAVKNIQKGLVNFKSSLIFAIPAVIAVFSTRKFIIPAIPHVLLETSSIVLTKEIAIMIFFALLMLVASFSMIIDRKDSLKTPSNTENSNDLNIGLLILLGVLTGLITGSVGAGGGFIIVPILVLLAKLPMKKAAATSLFIIAINSLLGFLGDVTTIDIDWVFLLTFSAIAVVGIFIGIYLNKFIDGKKLKKGFGWFVLLMGIYIFWKEMSM
ncbi:sulfite exporter TauE/SafE family protein [Mesonia maritima]|uniref:Probable membrane transporter protein n=1 Tax=Mesonia maritima TaxID=1793873 RepID=A0ABU1K5K0_9FLAO|nr:sulfite exporter TauE/SafE family protein [Mesonia maritima]MDR6300889.1 hypothetical protein [Mesonia maritima]